MKNLVSIIIPTYNNADYILQAVNSAKIQTYPNLEIIIIDDGSTDSTREKLKPEIAEKNIVYQYQENAGLSAARNAGVKKARGKYIALLDADDIFLPDKITEQVNFLEKNPDCDISYCNLYHFWEDKPNKLLTLNYQYFSGDKVLPGLLEKSFIAPLAVVLRKSAFDRFGCFDEKLPRSEDLDFWLRVAYGGGNICFLDKRLAKLRLRTSQNLQGLESQPKVKETHLGILKNLRDKMSPQERRHFQIEKSIQSFTLKTAQAYMLVGNKQQAKQYLQGLPGLKPRLYQLAATILSSNMLKRITKAVYFHERNKRLTPA